MMLTQSYEPQRNLLIGMAYRRGTTLVTQRTYSYDALGRPMTRSTSRDGSMVNDSFGYNSRSELDTATVNNEAYAYDYDNIGNRAAAVEDSSGVASRTDYTANNLNQYTAIGEFEPAYDDAGNQTKVKTSTGIWTVVYNAENRPTSFTNADGGTIVECSYDYMGHRASKKVTVNGSVTLHQRFLYRGYLQIACCDLTRSNHPCLWLITWDPSQPVATRPLAIQKDGTWYTYGWDLTKNICEVYGQHGYIRTNYSYSPYGEVAISGNVTQPILWSSEFYDAELELLCYNYRHYICRHGRFSSRDAKKGIYQQMHPYKYSYNQPSHMYDYLGLDVFVRNTPAAAYFHWKICVTEWEPAPANHKGSSCCWKKQKYIHKGSSYCIGFGPHLGHEMWPSCRGVDDMDSRCSYGNPVNGGTPMPPEMENVNGEGANGVVSTNNNPVDDRETGSPSHLPDIKTNCAEDIAIKAHFEGQVEQTADYWLVGGKANCRWYAYYMYNYVIREIINPSRTK